MKQNIKNRDHKCR